MILELVLTLAVVVAAHASLRCQSQRASVDSCAQFQDRPKEKRGDLTGRLAKIPAENPVRELRLSCPLRRPDESRSGEGAARFACGAFAPGQLPPRSTHDRGRGSPRP